MNFPVQGESTLKYPYFCALNFLKLDSHEKRKIDEDLKFRQDGPGWTSLLDSFSLIAGQVATLIKYLKDERTPELR